MSELSSNIVTLEVEEEKPLSVNRSFDNLGNGVPVTTFQGEHNRINSFYSIVTEGDFVLLRVERPDLQAWQWTPCAGRLASGTTESRR
ncbi:hypothetical protein CDAR_523911 [Caerostris darwini]|uniref:Uncharacterized protein n=1 Tax=Caerostris darwini TaxID=1538125 RepID=A0AAV4TTP0_9ARAC|nr:hypothetical protein CDAR_523911 [Caerostris darwini]